ncbi:hypothetical protein FRC03_004021 [Tulasnella sp. 419]|nr:hypothetical protein FRC03_004021 [Tulasnella sp. 419]
MDNRRFHFVRSPLGHLFISLLVSDLILALGAVINLHWVQLASIDRSSLCVAQGILRHVGAVGVAVTSAGIAIYTFAILFLKLNPDSGWRSLLAVDGLIWTFLIMIPLASSLVNTDPPYYGPSTHWCRTDVHYVAQQLGLQDAIMWFVALLNILLYVPLFLSLRGNIGVIYPENAAGRVWRMRITWRWIRRDDPWNLASDEPIGIAKRMLIYPIAYIILILPITVLHWIEITGHETKPLPMELTTFAGIIYSASGLVNVLLYVITRPRLLPLWPSCRGRTDGLQRNGRRGLRNDVESGMPEAMVVVEPPATEAPMLMDEDSDNSEETSEFPESGSTAQRMQNPGGRGDIGDGPEGH